MKRLIIAGHGYYPKGLLSSLEIIMGKQDNISTLCAYVEEMNIEHEIEQLLDRYQEDEIIVLTDLLGGSVNNFFLKYIERKNIHIIAGINLATLIEIVCRINQSDDLEQCLKDIVNKAHQSISYCNADFIRNNIHEASEF